ncbi:MAG: hypothetical protein UC708_03320 [Anaerovoracaceae bacterium]|nr:oligosaccharide flippase family protein [Bacillota bacterium]MEE0516892.1 hypothetical protein [Anaerovoracaceae bacterium]
MRLQNSARNIKAAWILQIVHILSQFVSRTAVIKVLTIEYVGLSGLFSNVLMMLSLAELGIGEAIIFSMYGPIARGEKDNIGAIMGFYKKVYISVGIFIMAAGLAITPWIDFFIKDMPEIPEIYWIYALYVINSSVSYFFSYKTAFITANQSNSVVVINNGLWEVAMVTVQVILLIATKNYILYMIIGIVFVLCRNISISAIADKRYPVLKEKTKVPLSKEIFGEIKKNTGAMVFHKIGTIIVFATDNLILSKFVGLISVGIYANYYTITNAVTVFINKFFQAISASVGNLAVNESSERQEQTFFRTLFINFWMYAFSCCCLFNLMNPFINDIWLGEGFLFERTIVLLMVIKIYFTGMRGSVQTFKNAKGLYWQNRYMPIYESLINLAASLILVRYIGVAGVIAGTIISSVTTCVWIEPHVLYKYGFKKSAKQFVTKYIRYLAAFAVIMAVTFICNAFVCGSGIVSFILRCTICVTVPNIMMIVLYGRSEEFKYCMGLLNRMVKKI